MSAHPAGPRHEAIQVQETTRPDSASSVLELDPRLWPMTATRVADEMQVGGCRVTDLVAQQGSPLYVLDRQQVLASAQEYQAAYTEQAGDTEAVVYYAAKALLTTQLAQWLTDEGLYLDVCTGGELAVAQAADVPGARILFHGNNKSPAEIAAALDYGVGRFVVDSDLEIARIAHAAAERDIRANVLLRVTVGVEAHTHEFIATAHEDQKFGLALAGGAAARAVQAITSLPSLRFLGLHSHIGSQIFDPSGFEVAAHRLVAFIQELAAVDVSVAELNLGGGMGIAYVPGDHPLDVRAMAAAIVGIVRKECQSAGLPLPDIAVEPGRAIVGQAGITLYTVGTIKDVALDTGQTRRYISVDGGMSDNLRTALYGAEYTVTLANRTSTADLVQCRVVGKHCESGDQVVRDTWLPSDIGPGDLLAVAATGAYCRSLASNYNYVPRPALVAVADGEVQLLLRRETEADLLALDAGVAN